MTVIPSEKLPNHYDKVISIDNLFLDSLNPREEYPSDALIESVAKIGFRTPVIVRPSQSNQCYYVTDGWERVQAGIKAGYTEVPCVIYEDSLIALREARACSIVNEWTKYQLIQHVVNTYNECIKRGMSNAEAIERVSLDNDVSDETVRRYLHVWKLPDIVKALLKQPRERSDEEKSTLKSLNRNIDRYNPIGVTVLSVLADYMNEVTEDRLLEIVVNILDLKAITAKKVIKLACTTDNYKPVRDIINEVSTGHKYPSVFNLPNTVFLAPEDKKIIVNYMSKQRIYPNDLIKDLLTDFAWSIREAQKQE